MSRSSPILLSRVTGWIGAVCLLGASTCLVLWAGVGGAALAIPMLLALPGFVAGKPYTFKWMSLAVLLYIAVGLMEAFSIPETRPLMTAYLICSGGIFACCLLFIKFRTVELERGQRPST